MRRVFRDVPGKIDNWRDDVGARGRALVIYAICAGIAT